MNSTTGSTPAAMASMINGPFEGTEHVAKLIQCVQGFLNGELAQLARENAIDGECDVSRDLLQQVWRRSHELGFYGMTLPENMGGQGLSVLDHALVKEAIYATGSPFASHVFGELSGPPRVGALARFATAYQMEHFILPVAQAEKAICFALTEKQAGSDAGAVQTTAVQTGDGYVVNGRKRFISGAPFADFAVLVCSTAANSTGREVSAFFVDLKARGVRVESGYRTMAGQSSTADLVFENVRLPPANLIGEPGRGLALALDRITVNRLLHCAAMLGLARVALDDSIAYAAQRQQFGRAIGQFQAIQHMLADMATELVAARALMIQTARQLDAGVDGRTESSMAKLFCSETAFRIADRAVQIHGGEGIVQGSRVEFLFRLLRMYRVLTGTSEIQRNTIAKGLLGAQ